MNTLVILKLICLFVAIWYTPVITKAVINTSATASSPALFFWALGILAFVTIHFKLYA